jgi:hypothetical protein
MTEAGGDVKSCLVDRCYAKSYLFVRCYTRLIFHDGVDNRNFKGYAHLCPEDGLVV